MQGGTKHPILQVLSKAFLRCWAVEILGADEGTERAVLLNSHVTGLHAINTTVRVEEVLLDEPNWAKLQ